jgi:hypothetical protein
MRALRPAPVIILMTTVLVILTAGSALAQYSFDWTFGQRGAVKDTLILEDFMTHFTNTSNLTDSFRVTLIKDMPSSWQATICEGPVCYPPFYTVHEFNLGPGESTNLDFAITATGEVGKGTSIVTVESLSNPAVVETNEFSVITTGLDVLNVDADGGAGYEVYFSDATASTGRTHATWTRGVMGALTETDLASFGAVVWSVGTNGQGLNDTDRSSLLEYVRNGGNLFLTGQNLVHDYCDPGSPLYSASAHAWFQDLLGVDFMANNAASSLVNGVPGDPVSNGMALTINGGDGANNNSSPDEILTLSNGATSMTYSTGKNAAARGAFDKGRTFFAAFGFEGLYSSSQRNSVMASVLDWITSRVSAVGNDIQTVLINRPYVVPNPFNPQTSVKFEVGGTQSVNTEVVIYDLRGREIRSLFRGVLEPGPQNMLWNGRDNGGRNLASGVYLAHVKVADQTRTVKMTLAR